MGVLAKGALLVGGVVESPTRGHGIELAPFLGKSLVTSTNAVSTQTEASAPRGPRTNTASLFIWQTSW